jgi:phosphocarrier protein
MTEKKAVKKIKVINKLGLHARPSAMLVQLANQFESDLFASCNGNDEINAKSIMGIMMLAAGQNTVISFSAEGEDREELLNELEKLFQSKFNED